MTAAPGTPYSPPPGFTSSVIGQAELAAFCALLERRASLPRLRPDADLSALDDEEVMGLAAALRELQIAEARESASAFVEFVLANEKTGGDLRNAQHHNEWHEFLDAEPRAVLFAPVEHAKTTHVAVGRTLFALGENPNRRLAVISNTAKQAEKILSAIKLNIEENPRVREVFPGLVPSERPGDPWHSSAITVKRTTIAKDPSVQALGVGGPLVGSRLDGVVLDDVLDVENTRTIEQMAKLLEWFETTLLTRLTDGAFLHVIGTPWNPKDLLHELASRPGFRSRLYSAVENPDDPWELWRPIWPEQFSRERLKAIRDDMMPANFARKYLCRARSLETARFKQEWIDGAIALGAPFRNFPLARLGKPTGEKLPTFTGVDLAIGKKSDSDLTVIFTIAVDERGRRIVLDIQSGRWQAPEILSRIKATHDRYDSIVTVEDNGAQNFLLQWAMDWGVPVRPFTTGRNKYDERFGVESIAVEMMNGRWVIPSGMKPLPAEVLAWIQEMLYYDPEAHTGDRLMASWFAREAARQFERGIQRTMDTVSR